jgi:hypothetical protein
LLRCSFCATQLEPPRGLQARKDFLCPSLGEQD